MTYSTTSAALSLRHHEAPAATRRRALLAEDDPAMRGLLAATLRSEGFEVLEAQNGRELTLLIDTCVLAGDDDDGVDLIVSDIRMPGPDGLKALARLRRRDGSTPVVLVTAFSDEATRTEARRLGAVALLDKPFELDELRTVVRHLDGWVSLQPSVAADGPRTARQTTIH